LSGVCFGETQDRTSQSFLTLGQLTLGVEGHKFASARLHEIGIPQSLVPELRWGGECVENEMGRWGLSCSVIFLLNEEWESVSFTYLESPAGLDNTHFF
jgi:hypothetical protein